MKEFLAQLPQDTMWIVSLVGVSFSLLAFVVGWIVFHRPKPSDTLRLRLGGTNQALDPTSFSLGMELGRRKSIRRKGNPVDVLISASDSHQDCFLGTVVDRSRSGLCVKVFRAVQPGAVLYVRPAQADEAPWVPIQVKHARQQAEDWYFGGPYVHQPAEEVLGLFG